MCVCASASLLTCKHFKKPNLLAGGSTGPTENLPQLLQGYAAGGPGPQMLSIALHVHQVRQLDAVQLVGRLGGGLAGGLSTHLTSSPT